MLEYLARALVADPDGVRVEADDRDGLTLNVYVADGDMGRVIGKRGRVANAIRAVGRAAAAKDGETGVAIEFVD
ncbi:KH domain-containing protein [Iamia sp. SCSIO 61187]|nr:KH domain-containing protein [Iamia sp. SCSIO 61187]